jgi:(p)ppGpp synthase/HD superfamily hydrolase
MLLAALLHDVAEKTSRSLADIEQAFGAEVAGVVAELTDDKRLGGRERKRQQVEGAATLSPRAKRIRLADKASKMAEIAAHPPRWWGRALARRKVASARQVVDGLRGSDPVLEEEFDREASAAESALLP